MLIFHYFILFFISLKPSEFAPTLNTELKLVQILFRHGDRSAVNSYPNDPYNETVWAKYGGFGQLTQTGMQQHAYFGRFLRDRYLGFLNTFYDKNEVFVRSTDFDRTLMSAYSLLSSLYPPNDYQAWNSRVAWQPIAVHTTDVSNDMIFYGRNCPRVTQLKDEVKGSDEFKKINAQHQKLFDIINAKSGLKDMNLVDLWKIGDVLFCQKTHGFRLPDWVNEIYDEMISSLKWGFYFDYRLTELAQLQSGGVLNEMRKNFIEKVKNNTRNQLYLFSGHDTYIAGIVRLLNLTEITQPPYASAIVLELHQEINNSGNYFVQVYYKNNTAQEPINYQLMTIYGCEELCPFDRFLEITSNLVVDDFPTACKIKS